MSKAAGKGSAKERKATLLIAPQNIGKSWVDILNIQFIDKAHGDIRLTNNRISSQLIKQNFTSLPVDARYAFNFFVKEAIEQKQYELELIFEKRENGLTKKQFIANGLIRYFHNAFMAVKPYFPLIKFYIKIVKGNIAIVSYDKVDAWIKTKFGSICITTKNIQRCYFQITRKIHISSTKRLSSSTGCE